MEGDHDARGGDDQPRTGNNARNRSKKQKKKQKKEEERRQRIEAEIADAEKKKAEAALAERKALMASYSDDAADQLYNTFYMKKKEEKDKRNALKAERKALRIRDAQEEDALKIDPKALRIEDTREVDRCDAKETAQIQDGNTAGQSSWFEGKTSAMVESLEIAGIKQAEEIRRRAQRAHGKQPVQHVDDNKKHVEMFEKFLASYKNKSDGNNGTEFFYKAYAKFMKMLGTYKLEVNFLDILSDKKYKDLAVRIGKSDEHGWLSGAVARFLIANGMDNEDFKELVSKVSVCFINKESLKPLNVFMRSKPRWKITANKERPLTEHGSNSFWLVIADVVKKHKKDISYNGKFKEEDILLGEIFCWIYTEQLTKQPDSSFVADFGCIWDVMSPFYIEFYNGRAIFPQNFHVLCESLHLKHFVSCDVKTSWFREFIMFSSSLAPSDAKRAFLVEMRRIVVDTNSQNEHFLICIPSGPWQKWGIRSKAEENDWTVPIKASSSPVMKGVFFFDSNNSNSTMLNQATDPNQQGSTQGKTISKGSETGAPRGKTGATKVQLAPSQRVAPTTSNDQSSTSTSQIVAHQNYANTVWGMLSYDRCVVEHGVKHCGGVIAFEDASSMEIHASENLKELLAYLMLTLLKGIATKDRAFKMFGHVWHIYKKLFRRPKED